MFCPVHDSWSGASHVIFCLVNTGLSSALCFAPSVAVGRVLRTLYFASSMLVCRVLYVLPVHDSRSGASYVIFCLVNASLSSALCFAPSMTVGRVLRTLYFASSILVFRALLLYVLPCVLFYLFSLGVLCASYVIFRFVVLC